MNTLAIITHETIGRLMTGPAIRALELARALHPDVRALVVTPAPVTRDTGDIETRQYRPGDEESMARALDGADVLLVQGFTLHKFPSLVADSRPIVVDLYAPFQFENLERRRVVEDDEATRRYVAHVEHLVLVQQLERGDFFICASDRQRDFWLGMLSGIGRLTSALYDSDPTCETLIAVVPFGVSAPRPRPGPAVLKGVHPGISSSDRLVLWGGSVTDWQDPVTPIRAVGRAAGSVAGLRLVLPAGIPNPEIPPMRIVELARGEAKRLGLLDRNVFFIDWVPYDDRGQLLLEAEIGVTAHSSSLETRYSSRTRVLDYIWASLPIVCARGDFLSEIVEREGLGIAFHPGDDSALADAFVRLLTDHAFAEGCRERLERLRSELEWGRVAEPLRRYCAAPYRTVCDRSRPPQPVPPAPPPPPPLIRRAARRLKMALERRLR